MIDIKARKTNFGNGYGCNYVQTVTAAIIGG